MNITVLVSVLVAGMISTSPSPTLVCDCVCSASCLPCPTPTPSCATFYPGIPLNDTDGNRIFAGGAGFYVENGTYYWYGESQKDPTYALSPGFNLYTSNDGLATWQNHGMVFEGTNVTDQSYAPPYRLERPKVIWNALTQKYVMIFHLDTYNFYIRAAAVATSDTPTGPFVYESVINVPMWSYDIAVYQEGSDAFLVSNAEDYTGRFIRIWKLTADYLDIDSFVTVGPNIEGQFLWKDNGTYYLIGSLLTGWSPNPVQLYSSPNLYNATWTALPSPTGGDPTTFNTQPTFVIKYNNQYIYVGDRWNYNGSNAGLQNMMTVFLPMDPPPSCTFGMVPMWTLGNCTLMK